MHFYWSDLDYWPWWCVHCWEYMQWWPLDRELEHWLELTWLNPQLVRKARYDVQAEMATRLPRLCLLHRLRSDASLATETRWHPWKEDLVHMGNLNPGHSLYYTDVHEELLCYAGYNLCVWPPRIDPPSHRLYLLLGTDAIEKQDHSRCGLHYNWWFNIYDGHSVLLAHQQTVVLHNIDRLPHVNR